MSIRLCHSRTSPLSPSRSLSHSHTLSFPRSHSRSRLRSTNLLSFLPPALPRSRILSLSRSPAHFPHIHIHKPPARRRVNLRVAFHVLPNRQEDRSRVGICCLSQYRGNYVGSWRQFWDPVMGGQAPCDYDVVRAVVVGCQKHSFLSFWSVLGCRKKTKFRGDSGVWPKHVTCPVMRCVFERIGGSSNMMGSRQLDIKESCHSNAAVRHYVMLLCGCMPSRMQRRIRSIFCLCTICNETPHLYARNATLVRTKYDTCTHDNDLIHY